MKATFLLWNINPKNFNNRLPHLINAMNGFIMEHGVNVIVLIECTKSNAEALQKGLNGTWTLVNDDDTGSIRVLTHLGSDLGITSLPFNGQQGFIQEGLRSQRYHLNQGEGNTIRDINRRIRWFEMRSATGCRAVLSVVHFYSKLEGGYAQKVNQVFTYTIRSILKEYKSLNIDRGKVMIMGDFNLNPYEELMYHNGKIEGDHLLTFPSRKSFYHLSNRHDHFFYNPMWLVMGDQRVVSVPDYHPSRFRSNYTYLVVEKSKFELLKVINYEKNYNVLDGVLLAKDLTPYFEDKIWIKDSFLEHSGSISLLNNDGLTLNKDLYSDHLPIIFELDFSKEVLWQQKPKDGQTSKKSKNLKEKSETS